MARNVNLEENEDEFRNVINNTARHAVETHRDNYKEQVACALERLEKHDEWEAISAILIRIGVQRVIDNQRHLSNERLWNNLYNPSPNGEASRPDVPRPKVKVGESVEVNDAYAQYFNYNIAGKVLGDLKGGEQIHGLMDNLRNHRDGIARNLSLLTMLNDVVPDGQLVKDAVKGKKLEQLFKKAGCKPE